ncbi:oligosaccharide flippase family protein [Sphingomonas olei]|uniref:oligosaccharide flippase family protein n=1 Tax=Sphingomonas olei TaxID=1886787 RepID=UPI0024829A63|nr:oligosaccharide flippase family protein [Sphingomonas olei]
MRLLRSGSIVLFSNCVDVAAVLVRNVLLARLLSVTEFGLAATFAILMTIVETFQNVGLNRLVVQDPRADDPAFVSNLHGAQIVVSFMATILLILVAFIFAAATNTISQTGDYLILTVVPLINAFTNLDIFRMQRDGHFAPQALRSLLSQPLGLLAILPAYWFFHDHRVALAAILTQQVSAVALSHVGVQQSYRVSFDGTIARHAFRFGWPLVVNGLLMFFILNGDRMIVLNRFGPEALGWFSAALMLTMIPSNLAAKSLQTLALPALAKTQARPQDHAHLYTVLIALSALLAMTLTVGALLLGAAVLDLLFGARFHAAAAYIVPLACLNALRLFRAAPAIAALASAETRSPLYTNIVRLAGVPAALAIAATTGRIDAMILAGIGAELAAAYCAGLFTNVPHGRMHDGYYATLALLAASITLVLLAHYVNGYYALLLAAPFAIVGLRLAGLTANRSSILAAIPRLGQHKAAEQSKIYP